MHTARQQDSRLRPITTKLKSFKSKSNIINNQQVQIAADQIIDGNQIRSRSKRLTWCLICLIGAIFSLTPFLSLHLTQRIGLLIFESDLIQLRSSLFSTIICFLFLVILDSIITLLNSRKKRKSLLLQQLLKQLIIFATIISLLSYLSLALIVPQIRQTQRMPIATFDCNANQIIIENCHQQFVTKNGEQKIFEAINQLFLNELTNTNERLIKELNCFKYNNREYESLKVPTRFFLHKCGLVCKPHRQQLHQFSDDLNRDQTIDALTQSNQAPNLLRQQFQSKRLLAPYNQPDFILNQADQNTSSSNQDQSSNSGLVSLKVCFLGEISGGSNYKRFCIENLTSGTGATSSSHQQEQALTVGQLNAMLRKLTTSDDLVSSNGQLNTNTNNSINNKRVFIEKRMGQLEPQMMAQNEQTTHYVNPIVQFESHFKNWPHLSHTNTLSNSFSSIANHHSNSLSDDQDENSWCKFKPIPPFIVNNKPFSDIQCSLEHEYTMTAVPRGVGTNAAAERIYLKRSSIEDGSADESFTRERCNIQCKVNILYQIHLKDDSSKESNSKDSYYLPLKPCLIVSGYGDKAKTFNYYLIFRSLADSSLFIAFILVDLLLLIESIDTKQFQLEGKKFRLISIILAITLLPLVVALLFDLATIWLPNLSYKSREGYLIAFLNENLIPSLSNIFAQIQSIVSTDSKRRLEDLDNIKSDSNLSSNETIVNRQQQQQQHVNVDSYLVPFLIYATFMFTVAINSFKMPLVAFTAPLVRAASTEELGITKSLNSKVAKLPSKSSKISSNQEMNPQIDQISQSSSTAISSRQSFKVMTFAMLTLFMGLEFNLSQFTQTQILIESFGIQSDLLQVQNQQQAAFWFILATHSSGVLLILILVLLFSDEMSAFLSEFSPFKPIEVDDKMTKRQTEVNFQKNLCVSLLAYSLRYFVLANITHASRMKWPLVFLYQASELLNFPLTWFALTARAHELIDEHPDFQRARKMSLGDAETGAFNGHLLVQSSLAFVYFVLGRLLALFVHSLHASLNLHNDNVDWFVTSFYGSGSNNNNNHNNNKQMMPTSNVDLKQTGGNNSTSTKSPDALFSPLPDERQNYLHASRMFIRYNSLICLFFGLILLVAFIYAKCLLWSEQKRLNQSRNKTTAQAADQQSDLLDEHLSLDLMRIHSNNARTGQQQTPTTTTHPPRPKDHSRLPDDETEGQRARIHFHYDLGRRDSSASSSSSDRHGLEWPRRVSTERNATQNKIIGHNRVLHELRVPIALAEEPESIEEDEEGSGNVDEPVYEDNIERITRIRNKRIRIIEDGPVRPLIEGNFNSTIPNDAEIIMMTTSPPPPQFADNYDDEHRQLNNKHAGSKQSATSERNRRITFAPTTTLIGESEIYGSRQLGRQTRTQASGAPMDNRKRMAASVARRASPEPSIGDVDDDNNQVGEADSIDS